VMVGQREYNDTVVGVEEGSAP